MSGDSAPSASLAGARPTPVSQLRIFMDTAVSIEVWSPPDAMEAHQAISRAFNWFRLVEASCSRFDPQSELARLSNSAGSPVSVSPLLFQALQFALAVAEETGGAFDPTIGDAMVRAGFRRSYRDGSEAAPRAASATTSYRDVSLDPSRMEVTLRVPLTLDLGAVAKGMALDLASEELRLFPNHAITAGGDLLVRGVPPDEDAWPVEIRDPREPERICSVLRVRDAAVCTSGGYLRVGAESGQGHHLLDPGSGRSPNLLASATVVAPGAMLADALATAAFVIGPRRALPLLERYGVEGLLIDPALDVVETRGLQRWSA